MRFFFNHNNIFTSSTTQKRTLTSGRVFFQLLAVYFSNGWTVLFSQTQFFLIGWTLGVPQVEVYCVFSLFLFFQTLYREYAQGAFSGISDTFPVSSHIHHIHEQKNGAYFYKPEICLCELLQVTQNTQRPEPIRRFLRFLTPQKGRRLFHN
jgi:hypothetical protein